jgi:hypothetical protein
MSCMRPLVPPQNFGDLQLSKPFRTPVEKKRKPFKKHVLNSDYRRCTTLLVHGNTVLY